MQIKFYKKSISLLFSLLLAFSSVISLTGCKKNNASDGENQSSDTTSRTSSAASSAPNNNNILSQINSSDISSSSEPNDQPTVTEPAEPTVTEPAAEPVIIDISTIDLSDLSQYENEKKGWGQGNPVDENNRPVSCDQFQNKYGEYGGLYIMPADEPKMYLTFDEGYENGYTPVILDALKEKDCKAVFFVTASYAKANPELIQRMIDEGHAIGNHSVRHLSMPTLDEQAAANEIAELHNYMVDNYNYQMTLFRPPMGEWSTRTLAIANKLGYKTVFWSYAYLDYDVKKQIGVDKAFPKVTKAAHNGAIYLLHAVSKDNADMLGNVIDRFREDGFTLELLN